MSDSATLTMVMSRMAMSAPPMAAAVMPALDPTSRPSPALASVLVSGWLMGALARVDRDVGAHAGAQRHAGIAVELDEHGDALGDLDEVPRGVVRRQEREAGAGGAGDAVDAAG